VKARGSIRKSTDGREDGEIIPEAEGASERGDERGVRISESGRERGAQVVFSSKGGGCVVSKRTDWRKKTPSAIQMWNFYLNGLKVNNIYRDSLRGNLFS
jgi:hypothetical protein